MESFIAVGVIVIIIGVIGYAIWIAANSIRPNLEAEEQAWQQLAKAHKLNFIRSGSLPDTLVSGTYRGHFLVLRTLENEATGQVQTRVSLQRVRNVDDKLEAQVLSNFTTLTDTQDLKGWFGAEPTGSTLFYQQTSVETDGDYLRRVFNLLDSLINLYPQMIKLGGESIPALQAAAQTSEVFRPVCIELVKDMAQDTTTRLKDHLAELWCPSCITRFKAIPIRLAQMDTDEVYYGCRTCGQSAEVLQLPQGVVALLDNQAAVDQIEQQGVLKVNWLSRRELFDFDRVEIVQASDEDVERFAVQVGNDTDEWRQARYQTMECIIAPNCQITANSPKVLQSIFGKVTGFSEGQLSEVGLS